MRLALRAGLVAVVAAVAVQSGAAAPARTRPITTPLSVVFWSPNDGLLGAGVCRTRKYECGHGAVELTTDGGRTYRVVLRTGSPVTQVQTVGPEDAVAIARGHAWRTLDGGRTWHRWDEHPGGSAELAEVSWPTARLGFTTILGAHGHVFLWFTQDAGRTWQKRRGPCQATGVLVSFPTPRDGWLACLGEGGAGNEDKAIFRTQDGGRTWRAGAFAEGMNNPRERGGLSLTGYPAGIAFAPNGFGLMWESRGTVYVTRDGGKEWHAKPRLARFDVDFGRGASAFANGTGLVLLSYPGGPLTRLVETHDFGQTWHLVRRWRAAA